CAQPNFESYTGSHLSLSTTRLIAILDREWIRGAPRGAWAAQRRAVMAASDGIGPKGSGAGIGTDRTTVGGIGDEAASVIELTGVIKWFDVSKGYGFIIPDNGLPDILLHVTCLRRDGYQVAYEGARVVVEVLQRARGLQAFRILSMDESTAVHPAQMPPP